MHDSNLGMNLPAGGAACSFFAAPIDAPCWRAATLPRRCTPTLASIGAKLPNVKASFAPTFGMQRGCLNPTQNEARDPDIHSLMQEKRTEQVVRNAI